jgi:hypothetical protein
MIELTDDAKALHTLLIDAGMDNDLKCIAAIEDWDFMSQIGVCDEITIDILYNYLKGENNV